MSNSIERAMCILGAEVYLTVEDFIQIAQAGSAKRTQNLSQIKDNSVTIALEQINTVENRPWNNGKGIVVAVNKNTENDVLN